VDAGLGIILLGVIPVSLVVQAPSVPIVMLQYVHCVGLGPTQKGGLGHFVNHVLQAHSSLE